MPSRHLAAAKILAAFSSAALIAGCGSSGSSGGSPTSTGTTASSGSGSSAAANVPASEAQSAATGDIPDNQTFLTYKNGKAGYSILYPEGWARKGSARAVSFSDKDNQVRIAVASGGSPTVATGKSALAGDVPRSANLKVQSAKIEPIKGTPMVHIVYREQGPADPVTGKRLTVMVDRYVFAKGGKVATVDESTPVGVDNVDAYRMIIQSFKWG
jgi:hypothetical protein